MKLGRMHTQQRLRMVFQRRGFSSIPTLMEFMKRMVRIVELLFDFSLE